MKYSIGIIGAGRVGSTLAVLLSDLGYDLSFIVTRSKEKHNFLINKTGAILSTEINKDLPKTDLVLITTPDDVIKSIVKEIINKNCDVSKTVFAHTSGVSSSRELASLKKLGANIGSVHPLKSFSGRNVTSEFLHGTYFSIEGEKESLKIIENIVLSLKGIPFFIKTENKGLYHASACAACNYLTALTHYAVSLLKECGLESQDALSLLKPLMTGTIENIFKYGPNEALTGPIERGDVETLKIHLRELDKLDDLYKSVYSVLGLYTNRIAFENDKLPIDKNYKVKQLFEEV
jgi:predicted short-subunit dehydrogenase-like oxidoreductase (DUF2520 family)